MSLKVSDERLRTSDRFGTYTGNGMYEEEEWLAQLMTGAVQDERYTPLAVQRRLRKAGKSLQGTARHGKAKDLTDSHLRQSRSSWKSRTTGAAECVDRRKSCFTFLMPRSQLNSAS